MVSNVSTLLTFIVALIISTIIIYYIAKFFGAKDSLTTAVLAALIGTAVYTIFFYVLGNGLKPHLLQASYGSWHCRNCTPSAGSGP